MFSYETGVGLAFLLWLYNAVMIIVSINSQFERNLNRIGQRLSWFTLLPKPMEPEDQTRSTGSKVLRYLLIVGVGLPFVLLSWLNVLLAAATIIYRWAKDSGAPQVVRELRWRMRNVDMTFDQIVKELMKASDVYSSKYEEFKGNLVRELEERGVKHG